MITYFLVQVNNQKLDSQSQPFFFQSCRFSLPFWRCGERFWTNWSIWVGSMPNVVTYPTLGINCLDESNGCIVVLSSKAMTLSLITEHACFSYDMGTRCWGDSAVVCFYLLYDFWYPAWTASLQYSNSKPCPQFRPEFAVAWVAA